MISEKMTEAFNYQINREIYSAYLYSSMGAYLADIGLNGFANWMRVQTQEELFHAQRMFDYVIERGGKVKLKDIEAPDSEWENVIDVYQKTLTHEEFVTSLIYKLADVAESEKDRATLSFLQWFIDEQVEEENTARDIIAKLKLVGLSGDAIFTMDKEFATRVFVVPVI